VPVTDGVFSCSFCFNRNMILPTTNQAFAIGDYIFHPCNYCFLEFRAESKPLCTCWVWAFSAIGSFHSLWILEVQYSFKLGQHRKISLFSASIASRSPSYSRKRFSPFDSHCVFDPSPAQLVVSINALQDQGESQAPPRYGRHCGEVSATGSIRGRE